MEQNQIYAEGEIVTNFVMNEINRNSFEWFFLLASTWSLTDQFAISFKWLLLHSAANEMVRFGIFI